MLKIHALTNLQKQNKQKKPNKTYVDTLEFHEKVLLINQRDKLIISCFSEIHLFPHFGDPLGMGIDDAATTMSLHTDSGQTAGRMVSRQQSVSEC